MSYEYNYSLTVSMIILCHGLLCVCLYEGRHDYNMSVEMSNILGISRKVNDCCKLVI